MRSAAGRLKPGEESPVQYEGRSGTTLGYNIVRMGISLLTLFKWLNFTDLTVEALEAHGIYTTEDLLRYHYHLDKHRKHCRDKILKTGEP